MTNIGPQNTTQKTNDWERQTPIKTEGMNSGDQLSSTSDTRRVTLVITFGDKSGNRKGPDCDNDSGHIWLRCSVTVNQVMVAIV